jgi:ATP-dependent DNA ligase
VSQANFGIARRWLVAGAAVSTPSSRVHWVCPEMVVEVSYVEMTPDGLLRHVVYLGEREDKPARDVIRSRP